MVDPKITWFTGPCHLIACRNENQHGHLACPECESVGFRNPNCVSCANAWGGDGPDPNTDATVPVTERRRLFRSVTCPRCGARREDFCRNRNGISIYEHSARQLKAITERRWVGVRDDG